MLSEDKIKQIIPNILKEKGGIATKKEICKYIESHYQLDKIDDLEKSNSRNEPKYVQRVGNIVSHASKKGINLVEFDGFDLVKFDINGKITWKFALQKAKFDKQLNLFGQEDKTDTKAENKTEETTENTDQETEIKSTKTDWKRIDELRKQIAIAGEKYVYEKEIEFVKEHYPNKIDKVIWVSQNNDKKYSYDIQSICHDNPNKILLIEVKSTTNKNVYTPFIMSANELKLFKENDDRKARLELHRNYDMDENGFKQRIFTQKEIKDKFRGKAINYLMEYRFPNC